MFLGKARPTITPPQSAECRAKREAMAAVAKEAGTCIPAEKCGASNYAQVCFEKPGGRIALMNDIFADETEAAALQDMIAAATPDTAENVAEVGRLSVEVRDASYAAEQSIADAARSAERSRRAAEIAIATRDRAAAMRETLRGGARR